MPQPDDFYTLYFGLVLPAMKSAACEITGKSSIVRSPGNCLATVNTVGRKLPNKFKNPKPSNAIPTRPHLITTNAIPRKKQIVPLSRSRLWCTSGSASLESQRLVNFAFDCEEQTRFRKGLTL